MKAPVRATRRSPPQTNKRTRAHKSLIYKAHKEAHLGGMRGPDFLIGQLCFPRPVLLQLVSAEASRLSRTNRQRVITVQEITAAATLARHRICTHRRAAA